MTIVRRVRAIRVVLSPLYHCSRRVFCGAASVNTRERTRARMCVSRRRRVRARSPPLLPRVMERPTVAPMTLGCFSAPRNIPESALTALRGILRTSLSAAAAPVPPARRYVPHRRHASPPQRPDRHVTFDSPAACTRTAGTIPRHAFTIISPSNDVLTLGSATVGRQYSGPC
uniref:Uncharacterized protein n=1 Tax=Sipha flava TaxID=143950 RepID=A0A2S2QFL1_9HEMI